MSKPRHKLQNERDKRQKKKKQAESQGGKNGQMFAF